MAPGPTPLVQKPQAQRYRRGKLPNGAPIPSDDSSDDEEEQQQPARGARKTYVDDESRGLVAGGAGRIITSTNDLVSSVKAGSGTGKRSIQVALRDVKVEKDGALLIGGKREVGRTEMEGSSDEEEDDEAEEDADHARRSTAVVRKAPTATGGDAEESSEYETDSGEEESSEEEPPKPVYRPTFVPKRARETVLAKEAEAQQEEELWKKREEEAKARKKESRNLVGESIRRELAEKEASENVPDVDDTDDLDPEAEFEAWRLRELSRLTRDKEAALLRREEQEEIERRRALPEAQRLREDEEHARKTREEKEANRGERAFMEKFYHKGAFYQEEDILKRNYNVKTENQVDVSLLPKAMQVRNFGKASRSKYTHLKDQDTTQGGWDRALRRDPGAGLAGTTTEGCFNCGGPHLRRDCPNTDGGKMGGPSASGTNTSSLGGSVLGGQRTWGARDAERGAGQERREPFASRERDERHSDYVPRSRKDDYDGDRERERYPGDRGYSRDKGRSYDDRRERGGSRSEDRRTRRTSRSRSPRESYRRDEYRERDRDREGARDYRR